MSKCLFNRLFLLRRALGNFCVHRFCLVVTFPLDQPMLGLDLSDIRAGHLVAGMFQHVILNLLIGCVVQDAGHIHILQGEFHADGFAGDFPLGKRKHRLDVSCPPQYIDIFHKSHYRPSMSLHSSPHLLFSPQTEKLLSVRQEQWV